jgi:hypothetical protein
MNFLITYPIALIVFMILFSLLVALAVGGVIASSARRMPRQSDVEPCVLQDVDVTASVAVELAGLGFEVRSWGPELQITDREAITLYMPKYATLEQCLERYAEKLEQFKAA